ncbi:U6 snRNA-associated Sm-like protein LSm7 [Cladochytrium replicatum]|nr:U6 snRNA-associated Sm-like protein LSm7 [Cladochytrium replicatum]
MSDQRGRGGYSRGRGGGGDRGSHGIYRGGGGGGRGGGGGGGGGAPFKKEPILDLAKYLDKRIRVKFQGGREVTGILKGYDPLTNLVLDDTLEGEGDDGEGGNRGRGRKLGLVVCRCTAVMLIAPTEGYEEIPDPFTEYQG